MPLSRVIRVAHTADLEKALLGEVWDMLVEVFEGDIEESDWEHALGGIHSLAYEDSELVGHASVVQRRLIHDGRALRTGYVEAVATAAPWRRRGVGSAVMAEVERLVAGGFELGALSSSRQAVRFYAARSWQRWTGAVAALTPQGVVDSPGEAVFVLPTPHTPAGLDTSARLVCDWRPGDLW